MLSGVLIAYLNRDFTGWFAYAPLSNKPFTANGAAFITQGTQAGLALMGAGLLVLAFWAGYRVGRRPDQLHQVQNIIDREEGEQG